MGVKDKAIAATVLRAIDHAVAERWDIAQKRAAATSGTTDRRVDQLTRTLSTELAAVGATAGGIAALPGVGTVASLAASAADVTWTTTRAADAVMTVGAIHGRTDATEAERRAWVIAVLGFGDEAPAAVGRILAAEHAAEEQQARGRLSGGSLAALNQGMVRSMATKWMLKKLATSIGKALPFGIGAVVGGVANRASARTIARHAHHLFATMGATTPATTVLTST